MFFRQQIRQFIRQHVAPVALTLIIACIAPLAIGGDSGRGVILTDPGPNDQFYPVSINNWWGLMNQNGNLVVYPQFEWTDYSFDSRTRVVRDGKTGFIAGNRVWLIKPTLPYADRYANNAAIIGDGEHFGYIDKASKLLVPVRLDGALRFKEGFAAVQVDDRCGFINRNGDLVIDLRFARVRSFHQGLAMVQLPDEPIEDQAGAADGDAAQNDAQDDAEAPTKPGILGYIDKRGHWAFRDSERRFEDLGDFNQNLARAKVDGKWGYINRDFRMQIAPRFDGARDFTNGFAAVKIGEQWGYIDRRGEVVIPPRLDGADDFDDTPARIEVDDRFGYINKQADVVVPPRLRYAEPFFRNFARVARPPSFGYIDIGANVVWDPRDPLDGIRDVTTKEKLRLELNRRGFPGNRSIDPPDKRDPTPLPYAPEYIYEEELPDPIQLRWRDIPPQHRMPFTSEEEREAYVEEHAGNEDE